jgi:hypothetical protein
LIASAVTAFHGETYAQGYQRYSLPKFRKKQSTNYNHPETDMQWQISPEATICKGNPLSKLGAGSMWLP